MKLLTEEVKKLREGELRRENAKLRKLLAAVARVIDRELCAIGEDEWKQHPEYIAADKLCMRIAKALGNKP